MAAHLPVWVWGKDEDRDDRLHGAFLRNRARQLPGYSKLLFDTGGSHAHIMVIEQ